MISMPARPQEFIRKSQIHQHLFHKWDMQTQIQDFFNNICTQTKPLGFRNLFFNFNFLDQAC